jgi:hypothetical protein
MNENPTIIFLGAGAVGASLGAWIAPHHENTYFLDIGEVAGVGVVAQRAPPIVKMITLKAH